MQAEWWKKVVAYHIYPRSFSDSNNDGIGDIRGVIQHLDYLHWLGVKLIWLSPVYKSPMDDNGYDISDYQDIDPLFGTLDDMDELIKKSQGYGMKIIMDLVVNHCSDEHPWFRKALADPNCEEASYFIFKPGDQLPTNWKSNFGGSVWEKTTFNRYYMHTFSRRQPDLNWENPKLRQKIYAMIRWWLDRGIAGFRVDAITFIKKDTSFSNGINVDETGRCPIESLCNYPGIDKFLIEMRDQAFQDCVTIAEAANISYDDFGDYIGKDGYFSMIFDFIFADYSRADKSWSISNWIDRLYTSQIKAQSNGWTGIFFENHDCPRSLNKYFPDGQITDKSAKLLATILLTLRGTPFIYQGQELGMRGIRRDSISQYSDVSARKHYNDLLELGIDIWNRDDSRLPFAWDKGHCNGFSEAEPPFYYVNQPDDINVVSQKSDFSSILSYYRALIHLRQESIWSDLLQSGDFEPLPQPCDTIVHYKRHYENQEIGVIANMDNREHTLDFSISDAILNNYKDICTENEKTVLYPHQALIYQLKK